MMKHIDKEKIHIIMIAILVFIIWLTIMGIIGYGSVKYVLVPYTRQGQQSETGQQTIYATDGEKLAAYERETSEKSHYWVILVHSYRTDHSFMNPYAKVYQEQGYNVLQPDNRGHGKSGGDYIGMGYLDQYDIRNWIDYIIEKDSDAEIILHGVSMGGAALMMLSGQEDIPENVKVIIEDSGYTSAEDYLVRKLRQRFHLPGYLIIPIANKAFKVAAGYYMEDASALEGVKNSDIPILFIHGTDDQTVPLEDAYKLYKRARCEKELYIVEGAGHGEALWKDETSYWGRVFKFIGKLR